MAVYVDQLMSWGTDKSPRPFRKQPSCHMYADSLEELHRMAEVIGLKRAWFQNHATLPHYDLTPGKRIQAVKSGAVEQTMKQMYAFMRGEKSGEANPQMSLI